MAWTEQITLNFSSPEEELEHNQKLFKTIQNYFIHYMPAVQLTQHTQISEKLTMEEMQKVQKKHDIEGGNAAARLLLETLHIKPRWFPAFMEVLENPDLRLEEFRPKFYKMKAKVDSEWVNMHQKVFNTFVCNPSTGVEPPPPTQSSESSAQAQSRSAMVIDGATTAGAAGGTGTGASGVAVTDDFTLSTSSSGSALQKDAAVESMETETPEVASTHTATPVPSSSQTQASSGRPSSGEYTDARSTGPAAGGTALYEPLQSAGDAENEYTYLANVCLERDACPEIEQATEPSQNGGALAIRGAEPQLMPPPLEAPQPQRRRSRQRSRPQTREDHPSLCQAISREPAKDFESAPVVQELSSMEGWSNHDEEHKVIQLIRPHRHTNGYYVIWFWTLAKRPTICVAQGGRVVTFVVHKSMSRPATYYINRRQKRTDSLRNLLQYHLTNGIRYTPQGGQEATIWLSQPH